MSRWAPPPRLRAAVLAGSLACIAAPAGATQSLDAVRAAAEQAVLQHYALPGNRVVVHTEPLDLRLQLVIAASRCAPACPSAPPRHRA